MSKAEEKAMQCCCTKCANNKLNCGMKLLSHGRDCIKCGNYIKGYQQAEKDLELTWEDISKIISIDQQVCGTMGISDYTHNHQQAMEEILKRFKEKK